MADGIIYHYKKNRKQRSVIFVNIAIACLLYIAGIYGAEHFFNVEVTAEFRSMYSLVFSISSVVMLMVALWLRTHPATYEATITNDRMIVKYPSVAQWSFDVALSDIKRFESRYTLSSGGKSSTYTGILMVSGEFHEICMNYGNSINKMYKAVKSVRPDVTFPKKANKKVIGFLEKDYDQ